MTVMGEWHPCAEVKPEIYKDYLVLIAYKYPCDKEWTFNVDSGTPEFLTGKPGYLDGWDTLCDWDEGQELHLLAWMDTEDLIPNMDLSQFIPAT